MKLTLRGGIALAGAMLLAIAGFSLFETCVILVLYLAKYVFGDGALMPLYRLSNMHHDFMQRTYLCWVGGLVENVLGTSIAYTVVDGDGQEHLEQHYMTSVRNEEGAVERYLDLDKVLRPPSQPGKAKIIIMNHHCRVDWIYTFMYFARTRGIISHIRYVLKEDLKHLPVLGWSMELFRYLFLSRHWEADKMYMRRMVDFYKATGDTPVILIYPEGTDLSPSNIQRSQEYAAKVGLPKFRHVLNPRTTGIVALMDMLGGADRVEEVVHLTIAYTYHAPGERPNELSLANGHHPKKVHMLIQSYRVAGTAAAAAQKNPKHVCPTEEAALTAWIHECFAEKELLLSRFLMTNPIGFDAADVRAVLGEGVGIASYDDDEERLRHPNRPWWRRYYQQVGFFGAVIAPVYWIASPIYYVFFTRWWLSTLWVLAVLVVFMKGVKAIGGIQQSLYLKVVTPEATLMQRLRRMLKGRQMRKDKKSD
ncbi:Acyltransferase / LPLAT1 [Leishmania donovani]|uniref:Acyltransferase_putative/Pfam:PF01553 n=1 Tax=Leishmania donovani TaxID=5661 RepID=A0A6J8FC78_LEIDO|nr:Acyltransferase / LPLAT1 [Leishmania donovani]VDZ43769.1 Acyltransferase_putative/Pfam:PF01553 [Leishmania donovani]